MAFLRLNGWRLPAAVKSTPSKRVAFNGELRNRIRNLPVRHRRSIERDFGINTTKMDEVCADTLEGLAEGLNHQFAFVDDAWSSSGLGPEDGSDWTINNSGGPVATRGYYVTVGAGNLTYNPEFIDEPVAPAGGRWTVIWWELNGSTWERRSLRSTGEKTVNGLSSGASFSSITVDLGGVLFASGSEIADLVLLSFYACDEYLAQEYDWVSGLSATFRLSGDDVFHEVIQSRMPTVVGTVGFERGKVGRGFSVDDNERIDFGTQSDCALFNNASGFSQRAWVRVDALPNFTAQLFNHNDTGAAGWTWTLIDGGGGKFTLQWDGVESTSPTSYAWSGFDLGTWYHFTAVYASGVATLYANGIAQTPIQAFTGVGGPVDDTGESMIFFDLTTAASSFDGAADELVIHRRALTAAQALEIYKCELNGRAYPGPRFSSPMPRLEMWGDIQGCSGPIQVIGEVTGQTYIQHGGSSGWTNNDREVSLTMHEVKRRPASDTLPRMDLGFSFSESNLLTPQASNDLPEAIASPYSLTSVGFDFSNRAKLGPFNWPDQGFELSGDYATIIQQDFAQFLYGATSTTLVAWVRATSLSLASKTVFSMSIDDVPNLRLDLRTAGVGSGTMVGSARSTAADGLKQVNSTTPIVQNEWAMVGLVVDLPGDSMNIYVDGIAGTPATGLGFASDRFSDEGPTASPYALVGNAESLTTPWAGQIGGVYLWRRALSAGEIYRTYQLGRKGIFS